MKIVDLAKELKITENRILNKLKGLKLRAKDGGELTGGVEMIVRDALADEGIGKRVVDEEEPKKKSPKAKLTKTVKEVRPTTKKKTASEKEETIKPKKSVASGKEKPVKKVVKKFVPALVKEEGTVSVKPKETKPVIE